jgi:lipopolysaccharide export system permease protein
MKILEKYVFTSFLTAFFLSWLILSFVLTVSLLVKIVELMIEGVPADAIGTFVLVSFPGTLYLTVPLALLVGSLLVFSRLSADSEIAAMRACGVNLLQIMRWPLVFAVLCTALCVWVNHEIVPRSHEKRNEIKSMVGLETGLELLEPGRMIDDFEKARIYFERKEGAWIHDLLIFDLSDSRGMREIHADKALITTNGTDVVLDMYRVSIEPIDFNTPGVARAERLRHTVPDALKKRTRTHKLKDMRYVELTTKIAAIRENARGLPKKIMRRELSRARTEYHVRHVYAIAALCFVAIGIPLGIKTQRKESSVGMAVSLAVALVYYLFVILAMSLDKRPEMAPYVLVWLPVALCGAFAAYLIPKNL